MDDIKFLSKSMKNPSIFNEDPSLPSPQLMRVPLTLNLTESCKYRENPNHQSEPNPQPFQIAESPQTDPTNLKDEDHTQQLGLLSKIPNKKYLFFAGIIIFSIFALSMIIWMVVALASKKSQNSLPTNKANVCYSSELLCKSLDSDVKNYILTDFAKESQQRSLLQLSRSFRLLENPDLVTISREDFLKMARNLTGSIECMMHVLPNNFPDVFQKMLQMHVKTEFEFERYLNLSLAFNDEIYNMKTSDELKRSCEFNLSENTRLLQKNEEGPENFRKLSSHERLLGQDNNCTDYQTILYFTGFGSPMSVLQNLNKLNSTLSSNINIGFTSRIAAIGGYQQDEVFKLLGTTTFLKFIYNASKESIIKSTNKTINQTHVYQAFMRLINGYYSLDGLQQITVGMFDTMQAAMEVVFSHFLVNSSSFYDVNRHSVLVSQLAREGRRIIFFAHGFGAIYASAVYTSASLYLNSSIFTSRYLNYSGAISMVYVAPYVSILQAKTEYITIPNDEDVSAFRKANMMFGMPMPANQFAKEFTDLSNNHSLIGYLDNFKDKVSTMFVRAKANANEVTSAFNNGRGLLNIALFYKNNSAYNTSSLNLKISQPNGVNISSSSQVKNGRIDYFSPSPSLWNHYYSKCSVDQGTYTVWMVYKGGSLIDKNEIYVSVVADNQMFVKMLNLRKLNYGDNFVCNLKVKYNGDAKKYDVQIDENEANFI